MRPAENPFSAFHEDAEAPQNHQASEKYLIAFIAEGRGPLSKGELLKLEEFIDHEFTSVLDPLFGDWMNVRLCLIQEMQKDRKDDNLSLVLNYALSLLEMSVNQLIALGSLLQNLAVSEQEMSADDAD